MVDVPWLQHGASGGSGQALGRLGALLKEYRREHRLTQAELGERLGVDQSLVSKIERGHRAVRDVAFLLAIGRLLEIAPSELGLAATGVGPAGARAVGDAPSGADLVRVSQEQWRSVRRYLNHHRATLAASAASLYASSQMRGTSLVAPAGWIPAEPVELGDVELVWSDGPQPVRVVGDEPESYGCRPMRAPGRQYERYTSAIRYIDPPALFENRPSYRLLDLAWSGGAGRMTFGLSNYFDKLDISEAVGHELAAAAMRGAEPVDWGRLPFRALVGDPFDADRRAIIPAITTLTLRRRRTHGTAAFLLHWRDPAKVATASGMYDAVPAGEFQPSSMAPWDRANDFDLWRNIVRELSEELLGTPEHDGSRSAPIDYDAWSLYRTLGGAEAAGKLSVYCLGVALDALTLACTIMTALVIDDDVFEAAFGEVVTVNAEGALVSVGAGHTVAEGIPFTDVNVGRLLRSEPMASPGAGCLALAWRHRGVLLTS